MSHSGTTERQLEFSQLSVFAVTQRRDLAEKLRNAASLLASRGLDLQLGLELDEAMGWRPASDHCLLILDSAAAEQQLSAVPRRWKKRHPEGRSILIVDHRDAMFYRSALKVGFDSVCCLEDAMRADFLNQLNSKEQPHSISGDSRLDFESEFGESTDSEVVIDQAGRIVFANRRFLDSVGLLQADVEGLHLAAFFPELTPAFLADDPVGKTPLLELRRASGNSMVVQVTITSPRFQGGSFLLLSF